MQTKQKQDLDFFVSTAKNEFAAMTEQLDYASIANAADLILTAKGRGNRIHISGIGKPGHIAGYIASLLSSTGTPTYFLHATEAVHGSCGQLVAGDVVIFISNSGETAEMRSTILAVRNNGCKIIGVSGSASSWLAQQSDVHLLASIACEGGPLNRAPRMSVLSETFVLQALSVVLQSHEDITPQQYVKWHPGGKLGQLRDNER